MSGDRERRTSSGSTLRLVAGTPGDNGEGAIVTDPSAPASIVLPGQRQSVAVGRHWVVRTAAERGVLGMANQVVELLSSELLANAVLHGAAGGAVGVQVRASDRAVRISVSDGGDRSPVVLHNAPAAPSGRGMAIVEAMSSRWGVDHHGDGGKTVWFELDLADF